jgi:hypothetical protein
MDLIYILEHKGSTSPISKLLKVFTNEKYSHTAMMIADMFCELSPIDKREGENDYHVRKYKNVYEVLREMPEYDAFGVPHKFSTKDIREMLNFWTTRAASAMEYGYEKLAFLPWARIGVKMMRRYYRRTGRPYKMKMGMWKPDVCSTAVDKCLKVGGYDIFPELSERVVYPGLYAKKLKDYKVKY